MFIIICFSIILSYYKHSQEIYKLDVASEYSYSVLSPCSSRYTSRYSRGVEEILVKRQPILVRFATIKKATSQCSTRDEKSSALVRLEVETSILGELAVIELNEVTKFSISEKFPKKDDYFKTCSLGGYFLMIFLNHKAESEGRPGRHLEACKGFVQDELYGSHGGQHGKPSLFSPSWETPISLQWQCTRQIIRTSRWILNCRFVLHGVGFFLIRQITCCVKGPLRREKKSLGFREFNNHLFEEIIAYGIPKKLLNIWFLLNTIEVPLGAHMFCGCDLSCNFLGKSFMDMLRVSNEL